jgi:branched-chain amino acid transport system ATP-binding protein
MRDEIWRVIRTVGEAGVAVLVVDKTVSSVLSLADHVIMLVKGKIAWAGEPDMLRADPALMHRHLGIDA